MDLGLTDRVYVLTGASRGLGFATAQALVADGARVVISSRSPAGVDEAVAPPRPARTAASGREEARRPGRSRQDAGAAAPDRGRAVRAL